MVEQYLVVYRVVRIYGEVVNEWEFFLGEHGGGSMIHTTNYSNTFKIMKQFLEGTVYGLELVNSYMRISKAKNDKIFP